MPGTFRDRSAAGRLLAERLSAYAGRPDVLVLALPRGGVPVAYEVARALGVPLDVFVVRKLGPARIVVAVPTAARSTCDEFGLEADECVCLITPDPFYAVGLSYDDFSQTTDDEVQNLLEKSTPEMPNSV